MLISQQESSLSMKDKASIHEKIDQLSEFQINQDLNELEDKVNNRKQLIQMINNEKQLANNHTLTQHYYPSAANLAELG